MGFSTDLGAEFCLRTMVGATGIEPVTPPV
jgi:hypothetical protein